MINSYLVKRFFFRIKKYGIFNTINKILNFLLNKNKIDLDNFKLDENLSLNDIFLTFGTDKGYLDGKKTYDYLKKKNKLEFENYFQWIKRKNIHSYGGYRHHNNNTIFYNIPKNNDLPKLTNLSEKNYYKKVDGNIYLTSGYYQDAWLQFHFKDK